MIVFRIGLALLGVMQLYTGSLQARAWRQTAPEGRVVRRSVGALAASRIIAGLAFLLGGILASGPLVICGAVSVLAGNLAVAYGRRQLERQS